VPDGDAPELTVARIFRIAAVISSGVFALMKSPRVLIVACHRSSTVPAELLDGRVAGQSIGETNGSWLGEALASNSSPLTPSVIAKKFMWRLVWQSSRFHSVLVGDSVLQASGTGTRPRSMSERSGGVPVPPTVLREPSELM